MCSTKVLVLSFALALFVSGSVGQEAPQEEVSEKRMIDCLEEGDFNCMKLRALANVYQLMKSRSLDLAEGMSVEYSGDRETEVSTARSIVDEDWGSLLFGFVPRLVKGLSLKLNIVPGGNLVVSRSQKENGLIDVSVEPAAGFEGRGDEKKKAGATLLMFGGLYTTLITLGLVAVKFLAFKGLLVGKVALVLAAINGLTRLFSHKGYGQGYGYYHVDSIEKSYALPKNAWGPPSSPTH